MGKKSLFISIDGMTDQLGQAQVIPYLSALAAKGFDVEICSCEKKQNFERNKEIVTALLKKAGIKWNYCFYSSRIPLLSQRSNFMSLKKLVGKRIEANNGNVFLHCRSYLPGLIGLYFKKKSGIPYVFDMRGFWADERIDGNIWKLSNPVQKKLYHYFKRKEREMLLDADHVVTLTQNAKTEICSWELGEIKNVSVIPCCADIDHFTIQEKHSSVALRKKHNIPAESFVVGYLGALGTWYMLNEMLVFFKELLLIKPDAIFFVVTNDSPEIIMAAAESMGIPSGHIRVTAGKRNEVPALISCFNVGLFFIRPLYSKKGSSPTKLAEILACGIPVVSNKGVGDMDAIIEDTGVGILINEFNPDEYRKAINALKKLEERPPAFYRSVAEKMFSLNYGVNMYMKIYNELSK